MIAILLVGTLILFVALGVPIAFSIVLAAASGILIGGVSNLGAIPMQMYINIKEKSVCLLTKKNV